MSEATGFRRISERDVYTGNILTMTVGTFESPDGEVFEREKVRHSGAVVVVALLADGDSVLLVRQFRSALEVNLLELPAGRMDVEDEEPEKAALRELQEETGHSAGSIELLGRFYASPGFSEETVLVYLARDLTETSTDLQGIEEQYMTLERCKLSEWADLVRSGAIMDGKTIIGLSLAHDLLGR